MNLILETHRLLLRPLDITDAAAFFKMDKNPSVHKYLWNKPPTDIKETLATIAFVQQQYIDFKIGRFAIILKETNQFVGWAGLKFNTEPVNDKSNFYDIGYRLDEDFWGKGYGTEASVAWLAHGFKMLKINTIDAAAHIDNSASNKILTKIGLKLTETYLEDQVSWNWYTLDANDYKSNMP